MSAPTETNIDPGASQADVPTKRGESAGWLVLGLVIVLLLGAATRYLEVNTPKWLDWSWVSSVEFPVYAIILGLIGGAVISLLGIRDKVSGAFRTEFFIKTGLVLLGASINLKIIVTAAGPAIIQALVLVSAVFLFTWWIASVFGIDQKLRALLATAVSICGVSAAIAAAGAVRATREQIAYTATLVIAFALPSIFILPWLADKFGLSDAVAGAWIGGNIDTTAAVAAAGTIAGEEAFQIATVVKLTQNVLIGFVAVALTLYFALKVERAANSAEAKSGVGAPVVAAVPQVRAGVHRRLGGGHLVRRAAWCRGHQLRVDGDQPFANVLPDPGVCVDWPGVPPHEAAARGLEASGGVRISSGVQPRGGARARVLVVRRLPDLAGDGDPSLPVPVGPASS